MADAPAGLIRHLRNGGIVSTSTANASLGIPPTNKLAIAATALAGFAFAGIWFFGFGGSCTFAAGAGQSDTTSGP